jgi:hypothetical protein
MKLPSPPTFSRKRACRQLAVAHMTLRYPRFWQTLAWMLLLTVAVLTLMPRPPRVDLIPLLSWDKAQHFVAYAVLMWTFLQAWEGRHVSRWVTLLVLVGVGLEMLQGAGGIRVLEYFDMFANSLGVALGYLVWRTPLGRGFHLIEASIAGS